MQKKLLIIGAVLLVVLGGYWYFSGTDIQNEENTDSQVRSKTGELFVYETPVDSQDECSSFELYDPEAGVCYFECSDEAQCAEMENNINAELESWTEDSQSEPVKEAKPSESESGDKVVAEYSVSSGENITIKSGTDSPDARKVWKHLSNISPDDLSDKYIETYQLFDDPESDTLAYVVDEDANGKWMVAVNLAGYNSSTIRERNMTLVHELGHIVTLNIDQLSQNTTEMSCKTFFVPEGCAKAGSYLNLFVNKFWTKSEIAQSEAEDMRLYREDKFLTEYASTNPIEDFAESCSYFVIDKRDEGNDIKNQKAAFLYKFPEMITIRDQMRSGVTADVIRARRETQ
mgnify:CR=1 FL=1